MAKKTENYLAVDLGAGSGRVMLGTFDGERVLLEEIHRFANPGVRVLDTLHWNVLGLFEEIKAGIRKAADRKPVSIGVDSWGVDFALLDSDGELIGNPYHYRDRRTEGMPAKALETVSREEIFEQTGVQFMEINSLYQLLSMKWRGALDRADSLLMIPDLFHYWLSGIKACELTDASTTQFYDPRKRTWATPLLEKLELPTDMLTDLVEPGSRLGSLRKSVADEVGLSRAAVVAPASHDTASAVAATPAAGGDWAYLSSGTWSLLGVETKAPLITAEALEKNFTNEGGVRGTTRLLKNISGLWLLEECRREWARKGAEISYEALIAGADGAPPFRTILDVDDPSFVAPGDMPRRILAYCRKTRQPKPETPGQFARAIFESLALKYRLTLEDLAAITGRSAEVLHIVGGGSKNDLLCGYAADACGVPVEAGPVEATALGNVLVQAMGMKRLKNIDEIREVARRSSKPKKFTPLKGAAWEEAAVRLRERA